MVADRQQDVERFAERFAVSGAAAVVAAEIEALGSDYRANGYTTVGQAIELGERLGLRPGHLLLDIGSGCGWPGLFLASRHGCSVVSVDPVAEGATVARDRAASDAIDDRAWSVRGAAEALPIRAGTVDAVVHTDLMC